MSQINVKKTKMVTCTISAFILLSLILFSAFFFFSDKAQDLMRLKSESYNGIFISMYSIENYSEEVFINYRGLDVIIASHTPDNMNEIIKYLDAALSSENTLDTIHIGLDPYKLLDSEDNSLAYFEEQIQCLIEYIMNHPEISFEIMLPAPSMEYWSSLNETETENSLLSYQYAVACISPLQNALCFWLGNEEWLISNPSNYTSAFTPNTLVSEKITCLAFCDHACTVDNNNFSLMQNELKILITATKESTYPDLSEKSIVFFGDSILGLHNGSYSIAGVMNALTNASVYNYAIGGTTACDWNPSADTDNSFTDQVSKFLNQADFYTIDHTQFPYQEISSEDIVFIINYGFNDYLNGFSITEFKASLTDEISKLHAAFPEAQIIILSPYENIYVQGGNAIANNNGQYISEYADAVIQLAQNEDLTLVNIATELNISEENYRDFFQDNCHYSEQGRFNLARHLINTIE